MVKRMLSVVLLAILALDLCCPAALAEDGEPGKTYTADGYTYVLKEDGSAEITGYTGNEKKLTIPSQLDGHTVVSIGSRAFYNKQLTEAVLPDTVKSIGNQCFGWCEKLKAVSLPDGLETISMYPFYYCKSLTKVNIPDSVTVIHDALFSGCTSLKEIALSPDHPLLEIVDGVLFKKADSSLLWYPASKKGKEYAVPDGTKRIGSCAFFDTQLEKIILPDSVDKLSDGAISNCTKLKTVNIPKNVTSAAGAVKSCDKLEAIQVDEGNEALESVGGVLFDKTTHALIKYPAMKKDKTYTVPEGTEAIMYNAFESAPLTGITIPGSVRFIGNNAFLFCEKLKEIVLPEGIEELGQFPFQHCSSLTKATLPASLTKIVGNPFQNCAKLAQIELSEDNPALTLINGCLVIADGMILVTYPAGAKTKKLEFPAGIRKIERYAFASCAVIEEIVFGEGLEEIAEMAFRQCKKLKRVVLPASLTVIDSSAFVTSEVKSTVFIVTPGSYAEEYCTSRGLKIKYAE